jgi:16S rRNA (cytosine1402-N4)-methyltransferase
MSDPIDPTPPKPPRRKRYPGTHPKKFSQKYKELNPEQFPTEIKKVISRGQTPAGTHLSILLPEVLEVLRPAPDDVVLDCTLGYGGHSRALAEKLQPPGRLLGVDLDTEELAATTERLLALGLPVKTFHTNFAGIAKILGEESLDGVDVLLADLGVSSMQLDKPERGFSFKTNGPLDMRMDRTRGKPASEWLETIGETALAETLTQLGDEPDATTIAAAIKQAIRDGKPPRKSHDLVKLVLTAKKIDPKQYKRKSAFDTHPAARTFQAIRMSVNRETANLEHLLRILPQILRAGGRAAIITFHSGEDKLVERAFEDGRMSGIYSGGSNEPIRPNYEEIRLNPRARSARLRWVRRGLDGC